MASRKPKGSGETYRVSLPESGDWSLQDLYTFPHLYEQCYAFVYCLDLDLPSRDQERIDQAFENYPWKGGYSYVNFYSVLRTRIPYRARPRLLSIHKASEGWIELALNLQVAAEIAKSVATIAVAGAVVTGAYTKAWKLLANLRAEREKARTRHARAIREQTKALRTACDELAKALGFKNLADLHRRTGDPEVSLKLLTAHFRRMRDLAEFRIKGKAVLPPPDDQQGGHSPK